LRNRTQKDTVEDQEPACGSEAASYVNAPGKLREQGSSRAGAAGAPEPRESREMRKNERASERERLDYVEASPF